MRTSESTKAIFDALAKAQAEFPAVPRNRTVTVQSSKGSYKFSYAPFEDVLRIAKPVLAKHGLAFTQGADGEKLVTVVTHATGEWFAHETAIINAGGSAQGYGSALTYAKRYGFCGAFGIQADDDDDGNAADGNTITAQQKSKVGSGLADMKDDAEAALSSGERELWKRIAADVESLVEEGRSDEAWHLIEEALVDVRKADKANETDREITVRLALWNMLGSKARAAVKKAAKPVGAH